MPQRTDSATLPLHSGKAPRWLFDRMAELAREAVNKAKIGHSERLRALKRLAEWE